VSGGERQKLKESLTIYHPQITQITPIRKNNISVEPLNLFGQLNL